MSELAEQISALEQKAKAYDDIVCRAWQLVGTSDLYLTDSEVIDWLFDRVDAWRSFIEKAIDQEVE